MRFPSSEMLRTGGIERKRATLPPHLPSRHFPSISLNPSWRFSSTALVSPLPRQRIISLPSSPPCGDGLPPLPKSFSCYAEYYLAISIWNVVDVLGGQDLESEAHFPHQWRSSGALPCSGRANLSAVPRNCSLQIDESR